MDKGCCGFTNEMNICLSYSINYMVSNTETFLVYAHLRRCLFKGESEIGGHVCACR